MIYDKQNQQKYYVSLKQTTYKQNENQILLKYFLE